MNAERSRPSTATAQGGSDSASGSTPDIESASAAAPPRRCRETPGSRPPDRTGAIGGLRDSRHGRPIQPIRLPVSDSCCGQPSRTLPWISRSIRLPTDHCARTALAPSSSTDNATRAATGWDNENRPRGSVYGPHGETDPGRFMTHHIDPIIGTPVRGPPVVVRAQLHARVPERAPVAAAASGEAWVVAAVGLQPDACAWPSACWPAAGRSSSSITSGCSIASTCR